MNNIYEFATMVEMEKRQKIAKDFYERIFDLDEHPLIVTDEASFYDIYMGDDPEAIDIIHKEYGVTLSMENFQMPFWKMLDILYTSKQQLNHYTVTIHYAY